MGQYIGSVTLMHKNICVYVYVGLYIGCGTPVSEVFTCVYVGQYVGSVTAAMKFFSCVNVGQYIGSVTPCINMCLSMC